MIIIIILFRQGRKLFVIGTTSRKDVLNDMEMLSVFSATIHVSNLSTGDHLIACLNELASFTSKELDYIARLINGKK